MHKIRMVGRWNCSVAIHYTRDAPISDMASDYMQARAARGRHLKAGTSDPSMKKLKDVLESTVQGMRDELDALNDKIKHVQRRPRPSTSSIGAPKSCIACCLLTQTRARKRWRSAALPSQSPAPAPASRLTSRKRRSGRRYVRHACLKSGPV